MNPDLSGEDLVIKTRKPYTITKQRERWTEQEHTKFLEALKLYGRAWQRIEEHIGTKTAVQIRSHAQKFFTKLEKEVTAKGEGNAHDIEIPPPRPKRKPYNPYPRKTCIASVPQLGLKDGISSDATSTLLQESMATFENDPEKLYDLGNIHNTKEYQEQDGCFDGLCASPASADDSSFVSEAPTTSCTFRQYIPIMDDSSNQDEIAAESAKPVGNHAELSDEKQLFHENTCEKTLGEMGTGLKQSGNCGQTSITDEQSSAQNYPLHVPVHILAGIRGGHNLFINPAATASSEHHSNAPRPSTNQPFFNYHPFFTPMQNSDDYKTILQMQSTFSGLILSSLSQNAAVYAAASFASTLWPWFNRGAPVNPSLNLPGFSQSPPMSSTPNMEAIVAATVSAATAWWIANGLLPVSPHPGYMYSPASATSAQMVCSQSGNMNREARENSHDPADVEFSDGEASEAENVNDGLNADGSAEVENVDSNKSENKKRLDRSSCGSNTTSGSEIEPDTIDKLAKGKDEDDKVHEAAPTNIDLFSRRSRSNNRSEEGRLAFQALFSREVLPQSFASSHDLKNKVKKQRSNHGEGELEVGKSSVIIGNKREGLFSEGLIQSKLKTWRTGFKPYKRCSMEVKETRISSNQQVEEKDPKKLRLETEVNGGSIS